MGSKPTLAIVHLKNIYLLCSVEECHTGLGWHECEYLMT